MRHAVELADQRLEERPVSRGITRLIREVPHRRNPLPVQEREREGRERQRPARGQSERHQRPAEERAEPRGVRTDGRMDEREEHAQRAVGERAAA